MTEINRNWKLIMLADSIMKTGQNKEKLNFKFQITWVHVKAGLRNLLFFFDISSEDLIKA